MTTQAPDKAAEEARAKEEAEAKAKATPKMIPEEDLNKFRSESQKRESQLRKQARELREQIDALKASAPDDDDDQEDTDDKSNKAKPTQREMRRIERQKEEIAKRELGVAMREAAAEYGMKPEELEDAIDEELGRDERTPAMVKRIARTIAAERKVKEAADKAAAEAAIPPRDPTPGHAGAGADAKSYKEKIKDYSKPMPSAEEIDRDTAAWLARQNG